MVGVADQGAVPLGTREILVREGIRVKLVGSEEEDDGETTAECVRGRCCVLLAAVKLPRPAVVFEKHCAHHHRCPQLQVCLQGGL